jgi:hypothetical protein
MHVPAINDSSNNRQKLAAAAAAAGGVASGSFNGIAHKLEVMSNHTAQPLRHGHSNYCDRTPLQCINPAG